MTTFDKSYRELKVYVDSQKSVDDKNVKDQVIFLQGDLGNFYQDLQAISALRKDLESAQKNVLAQNSDKTEALYKIYAAQNNAASIKTEFLAVSSSDKNKADAELKKLDDLYNEVNSQLTNLQNINSSFKSKVDAVTGKINQIKTATEALDPKKTALEKKVKEIADLKKKSATNKEAEVLAKIANTIRTTKPKKLPQVLEAVKEEVKDLSNDIVVEHGEAVASFSQKILLSMQDIMMAIWALGKRLSAAFFLKKKDAVSPTSLSLTTTVTGASLSSTTPSPTLAVTPITPDNAPSLPKLPTPGALTLNPLAPTPSSTPIAAPASITTSPSLPMLETQTPASSLSTTTTTTTTVGSNTANHESENAYLKDIMTALSDIYAGLKKLTLVLWEYSKAVYAHFHENKATKVV